MDAPGEPGLAWRGRQEETGDGLVGGPGRWLGTAGYNTSGHKTPAAQQVSRCADTERALSSVKPAWWQERVVASDPQWLHLIHLAVARVETVACSCVL